MKTVMRKFIYRISAQLFAVATLAFFMLSPCADAQSTAGAQVYSGKDVAQQLEQLVQKAKASGSSGATLGDFTSHAIKLSVRTTSGGAEVHAHYDDIFFVTGGSATLITGGHVLNAKTGADGETKGSGIEGGTRQEIHKGDVVHIPAGTPHQLLIAPGATYGSIVIKVKE
jgi:mannose-6-phosphate isomerase-like protein (cupin superfamily)